MSVTLILIVVLSLTACGDRLTMENYNKIYCMQEKLDEELGLPVYEAGMTLKAVKRILGKPTSNYQDGNFVVYVWGTAEKNITVVFNQDQAISKSQTGL